MQSFLEAATFKKILAMMIWEEIVSGSCNYPKNIGFDHLHFHHVFNLILHEVPSSQSPPCSQTKCVDMMNCNDVAEMDSQILQFVA